MIAPILNIHLAQDVKTIDSDGFTVGTDDLVNKW